MQWIIDFLTMPAVFWMGFGIGTVSGMYSIWSYMARKGLIRTTEEWQRARKR